MSPVIKYDPTLFIKELDLEFLYTLSYKLYKNIYLKYIISKIIGIKAYLLIIKEIIL
jgi:hypothetical protein